VLYLRYLTLAVLEMDHHHHRHHRARCRGELPLRLTIMLVFTVSIAMSPLVVAVIAAHLQSLALAVSAFCMPSEFHPTPARSRLMIATPNKL
jgi:hypothetical protein